MARFRYSMQSILNIKMKMETQAKQEFSAARAALDREEERLKQLFQRKDGYERRAQELLAGALDVGKIEENRTAIQRMEDYIAEQRLRVAAAETCLIRGPTDIILHIRSTQNKADGVLLNLSLQVTAGTLIHCF